VSVWSVLIVCVVLGSTFLAVLVGMAITWAGGGRTPEPPSHVTLRFKDGSECERDENGAVVISKAKSEVILRLYEQARVTPAAQRIYDQALEGKDARS
jgi:hypothetical protein